LFRSAYRTPRAACYAGRPATARPFVLFVAFVAAREARLRG